MADVAQTYPEHFRASVKLGTPLIASNLAQFAIHMTDTIMLGWYSVTALAAAVIATTFFFIIFIVGAGFAQAVTPLVASAAEEGDEQQVRRVTRMALWLSVFYGAAVMVPMFFAEDILLAIGQDAEVARLGGQYLFIALWGMIPALLVMTFKSFLAALEYAGIILWTTVGVAILNAPLNYALIFGNFGMPELGIRGAAIASVIMMSLNVLLLVGYALRKVPQYELLKNITRPDPEVMRRVFKLGWPIGVTSLAEGGLFSASAVMMGWIGPIVLAAHGIAIQLASLAFMIHIGLSQAATVRAGRALGRRDEFSLRRGGITIIALSVILATVTAAIFLLFPEPLILLFMSPDEPAKGQVLAMGVSLLALAGLFQVVDAAQVMALGLLRGVQDTQVPMIMAAISYWIIGLPVSYLLAFTAGYGAPGLWIGLVVGLSVASLLLMGRFWRHSVFIAPKPA